MSIVNGRISSLMPRTVGASRSAACQRPIGRTIASCSIVAKRRESCSITTSHTTRSPVRSNSSTTTACTSTVAPAGPMTVVADQAAGVDPRSVDELTDVDVVGERRPHRRMDDPVALVEVDVVAGARSVVPAEQPVERDPPRAGAADRVASGGGGPASRTAANVARGVMVSEDSATWWPERCQAPQSTRG